MKGYDNSYDGGCGNTGDGSSGSGDWDSFVSGTNTHIHGCLYHKCDCLSSLLEPKSLSLIFFSIFFINLNM